MSLASGMEIGGRAGGGGGDTADPPVVRSCTEESCGVGPRSLLRVGMSVFSPCIWEARTTQPVLWGGAFSG